MTGWNEGITSAIAYMEENLTEELDINEIASRAHVSSFYFRRIFHILCGFTVGEYIRNRRLTLAAQELCSTNGKVLDIALKYGYDSPDSFTKAFTRFHGVKPSAAKEQGSSLNSFAPLKIKLTLEGGKMLEYKIAEKAQFTVIGKARRSNLETAHFEIPKFWDEHLKEGENETICGKYGVCIGTEGGRETDYLIADDYVPCQEAPEGLETKVIPAGTWAIFPCQLRALQEVNNRIWSEWLPSCRSYKLTGHYNIEMYTLPCGDPGDSYCEIWMPVERV